MSMGYDCGRFRLPCGDIAPLTAAEAFRRRRAARLAADALSGLPPFAAAFSTEILLHTYGRVSREGGQAAGLDGLTYKDLSRCEAAGLFRAVSKSVLAGTYRPQPTRPVSIPKASGGTRTLRLPSILDRVVARRLDEVLTPVFERLFLQNSYGFRPGRSPLHVLAALEAAMHAKDAWVVPEDDVKGAFDNVRTNGVADDFKRVITDPQYMALIGAVLRGSAGGKGKEGIGIGQGCPFSPLALNVHLHYAHDVLIDNMGTLPFWFRYADNLVYLSREESEGRRARERSAGLLKQVGLTLKGPGRPIDLREGGSVQLLGLVLRLHIGIIRYGIPREAYRELEDSLEEAHMAVDPPEAARSAAIGWINSYGPAFEYSADDVVARVLDLADSHGYAGALSGEDIRSKGQSAHQSWSAIRERALREAGL
jgi:retron-type reverse transcriptase